MYRCTCCSSVPRRQELLPTPVLKAGAAARAANRQVSEAVVNGSFGKQENRKDSELRGWAIRRWSLIGGLDFATGTVLGSLPSFLLRR